MTLSKEEIERYSRQILLYGRSRQETLKKSHAIVIGSGGLGSTVLPLLAASGVGKIEIFDSDLVERTNLGRQLIFRESDLGHNKASRAAAFLRGLNPHVEVISHERKFTADETELYQQANVICEGSDSSAAKFLVSDLALRFRKPTVIGALGKDQGHSMLLFGGLTTCYRCLFDELETQSLPTCASEGILSVFPAVVGAHMAQLAVSCLIETTPEPGLWIFEKNNCRKVRAKKRQDCNHG